MVYFSTASDHCNMKTMHQFYSVYGDSPSTCNWLDDW